MATLLHPALRFAVSLPDCYVPAAYSQYCSTMATCFPYCSPSGDISLILLQSWFHLFHTAPFLAASHRACSMPGYISSRLLCSWSHADCFAPCYISTILPLFWPQFLYTALLLATCPPDCSILATSPPDCSTAGCIFPILLHSLLYLPHIAYLLAACLPYCSSPGCISPQTVSFLAASHPAHSTPGHSSPRLLPS